MIYCKKLQINKVIRHDEILRSHKLAQIESDKYYDNSVRYHKKFHKILGQQLVHRNEIETLKKQEQELLK